MPWKEPHVMEIRAEFALLALKREQTFRSLCQSYGISPKTGYKWVQRYRDRGQVGMGNRSRRPRENPTQLPEGSVCEMVRLKMLHKHWGPKKILTIYEREHGLRPKRRGPDAWKNGVDVLMPVISIIRFTSFYYTIIIGNESEPGLFPQKSFQTRLVITPVMAHHSFSFPHAIAFYSLSKGPNFGGHLSRRRAMTPKVAVATIKRATVDGSGTEFISRS